MIEPPVSRRLRILAFDPSLATRLDTATLNEITVQVPWEEALDPGPVGEYVEVVDCDPASGVVYPPVDLNHRHVLAQDGLPPSESDPQFHQQMVYAVAMTTIRHFERALGRVAFWADRRIRTPDGEYRTQFIRRLRIYPHAVRDRNAYYSPQKKALLFGYFPVTVQDAHNTPGTLVFTCLSHDVVAHEVTHALLDGVHPRFNEPSNPDVHAFHEAFADIVALFQHFSYPAVLESQIRRTRGNLHTESLLAQLAHQFGRATGRGSALRDALGETDATGAWTPRKPDPHALEKARGPHARGSVLVAAVFRAFLLIYRARAADLFRIATQGTGTLPDGDIHPDLAQRLAAEAARCAERVLQMCIRAIDYCPPVDITFGDFLRAVITADVDYAPEDVSGFRIVFIESFREWGIYPRGVTSLGVDALVWPRGAELLQDLGGAIPDGVSPAQLRQNLKDFVASAMGGWNLESNRFEVWKRLAPVRAQLHAWLHDTDSMGRHYARLFGLVIDPGAPHSVYRDPQGEPAVEVHAVRPTLRRTVSGGARTDLVIEITQRRRGYFDRKVQASVDRGKRLAEDWPHDFTYRAGCTILVDPETAEVRRVIRTAGPIGDDDEVERVRRFHAGELGATGNAFDAGLQGSLGRLGVTRRDEPFAMLHQMED